MTAASMPSSSARRMGSRMRRWGHSLVRSEFDPMSGFICAINNFILGKEGSEHLLKLTDLEFLTAFEGKTYAELPYDSQRTINTTQLTVYLVEKGTPSNVKFNVFKRVNTGGIPLTQQEIRHALHQGVASEFLKDLAESQEFKSATFSRVPSARMLDPAEHDNVAFEDLPGDWHCPVCGVGKDQFEKA